MKTCDDYIDDLNAPNCLRWYLFVNRLPAGDRILCDANISDPKLFAKYGNRWVRVVMASRLGDVGITYNLKADYGYEDRVSVSELSEFTSTKPV